MQAFVGITDRDWFALLRSRGQQDEVNFWQPSGSSQFRALQPGGLFLFKLHSPNNFVVGGGLFAHSSLLPISLAWEAFGQANGATDLPQMRERVEHYRRKEHDQFEDYTIGCILLEQPFFLPEAQWIPIPSDWSPNIVRGRGYDLTLEPGATLWRQLQNTLSLQSLIRQDSKRYGEPVLTMPRLGQGSFRVLVTDAYERKCALTNERTLPALEAAHIRPYSDEGEHRIDNGLLMRRDLHALFDRGYLTVSPQMKIEISRRIREEFENGKDYYRLHGLNIRLPSNPADAPSREFLRWHNNNVYRA